MKKRLYLAILPILLMLPRVSNAAEIKTASSITSVVVYPDRALVTRTADLKLSQGDHLIVFENLPANIDTDSIRTKGEGEARVRLVSTESKKIVLERPREEQISQLESDIQKVRDKVAASDATLGNLTAESDLVRSIGVYTGQQFSKEFITREPKPGEWNAMVQFQRENLNRVSEQKLQTEVQKRELNRQLDALLRKLKELQGQSARESKEVKVTLSALTPGNFELSLMYVIYGVAWYPSYDARADVKNEKIEFSYIGNVRQNSGEDWEAVAVSLSTARPAIGAKMPEIMPWYLRPLPPPRAEVEAGEAARFAMPTLAAPREAEVLADMATAELVQLGTSVQFKIPVPMNVPSDNAYHRATILTQTLPAKLSYAATPKLSPFAYLMAKLTNTTGAQWLAGKVSVFVDGDFIGTSSIKPVAANQEIDLDLGIDESVTVKREQLVRKEDEARIFGKKKERIFKDKLTVENHKTKAIELLLIDQVPVSQNDEIKVSDVKFSEKPTERDADTGIVKWKLSLAPAEKKEIIIEFVVTCPADMVIIGL